MRLPTLVLSTLVLVRCTADARDTLVTDQRDRPIAGALVTAESRTRSVTVYTDIAGRFRLPTDADGDLVVRAPGFEPQLVSASGARIRLVLDSTAWQRATSADLLGLLPPGEFKRRFVLDCTGCHQFDHVTIAASGGGVKDEAAWRRSIGDMIDQFGHASGFPILAPSRDADTTAAWLVQHVTRERLFAIRSRPSADAPGSDAVLTEYAFPFPQDLPHDLIVAPDGRVVITGMFTHRMVILDPRTGRFAEVPIPVENANPRAVEIAPDGTWWVLLGFPQRVARYRDGRWDDWPIGMYPHSVGLGADGGIWFNGHFTRDPELIGRLDPATGEVRTWAAPTPPLDDGGSTIPYELRVGPDGAIWYSQLAGSRVLRFDPRTERFDAWSLPDSWSGPRRFDLDAGGRVWIPTYAGGELVRFDPQDGSFRRFRLPVQDALPYVVRLDHERDVAWIGTAAADAVLRFDIGTERFDIYPLPSPGSLIRHIDIDRRTGALWAAYGASPARQPVKILRIRPAP